VQGRAALSPALPGLLEVDPIGRALARSRMRQERGPARRNIRAAMVELQFVAIPRSVAVPRQDQLQASVVPTTRVDFRYPGTNEAPWEDHDGDENTAKN
jgi:hypothetical protein